jgi:phage/plasmid-like protein (TIGR03299 family)
VPWHGLGTIVSGVMTAEEAIKLAHMDWKVIKAALGYEFNGAPRQADSWGIVREDTGDCLGVVGNKYQPIQNADGFKFLDSVIGEFGARYESCGSLYGGKQVWMLAHMPEHAFRVGGDEIEPYVIFANSHDGTGAAWCYPTTVRVVCANTFRTSSREKRKGMSIRHTGSVKGKIAAAQEALGLAVAGFGQFAEVAETMAATPCRNVTAYANDVLDACLNITQAQMDMGADVLAATIARTQADQDLLAKSFQKRIERRESILESIIDIYHADNANGSVWGAFNAVTNEADHSDRGRKVGTAEARASRRFESTLAGTRDEMKQVAFNLAKQLVK